MPKPLKFHELVRRLKDHNRDFEIHERRGKGSHCMLYHKTLGGRPASVPVPRHGGRDISPRILSQIIRAFNLPHDLLG